MIVPEKLYALLLGKMTWLVVFPVVTNGVTSEIKVLGVASVVAWRSTKRPYCASPAAEKSPLAFANLPEIDCVVAS